VNPILGVVLPVYNAEDSLREQVQQVLDAVTDLTSRFEVLIVDDASSDQTSEIAHELARQFPQVRVVRHAQHRGPGAACRTGATEARGEMIYIQEPDQPFRDTDLRRFWLQRSAAEAEALPTRLNPSLVHRLCQWAAALRRERVDAGVREMSPGEPNWQRRMASGAGHNAAAAHTGDVPAPVLVRRSAVVPR